MPAKYNTMAHRKWVPHTVMRLQIGLNPITTPLHPLLVLIGVITRPRAKCSTTSNCISFIPLEKYYYEKKFGSAIHSAVFPWYRLSLVSTLLTTSRVMHHLGSSAVARTLFTPGDFLPIIVISESVSFTSGSFPASGA